ncbi:MAG: DUF2848 domain-containing protein [Synergistetes bacterium]|nr:DUF2848 domain-containing protein [Synergistota bacterium]MCX8127475.1 DUF2848 domain-containing protein [Synergistota bacterium]MDW8192748.1 DUF2848 family protein [Synergistota bacterium]
MMVKLKCYFKNGGEKEVTLSWNSCVAAGYTGRNRKAVIAHIEELKKLGVPAPEKVPATYWIEPYRVTTEGEIYVIGEKSSGEVEFFLAKDEEGELYVTVGSDHTDRELERISVSKAKQICSKVIAPTCWKLKEIREHWDELILKMEVKNNENEDFLLYQEGKVSNILTPEELVKLAYEEKPYYLDNPSIFSGTIPILTKEVLFSRIYKMSLEDPILGREIKHSYKVISLPDKI